MSVNQQTHHYPVSVVAAIFFDQNPHWIRYQERKQVLEGIGSRTPKGDRAYTLDDVRKMAEALRRSGIIDNEGYMACTLRIESMTSPVFKRRKIR